MVNQKVNCTAQSIIGQDYPAVRWIVEWKERNELPRKSMDHASRLVSTKADFHDASMYRFGQNCQIRIPGRSNLSSS